MDERVNTNKNNVNQTNAKKGSNKKLVVKDIYKFITFIIISLIVIIGIIVIVAMNVKVKVDENTELSKLNVNKYKNEIKAEYEKEGKDEEFVQDWGKVQEEVGRYFIENYSYEQEEIDKLIKQVNETLNSEDWSILEISKPSMWNGKWSIDLDGRVIFKFASKDIEPDWAKTLSDSSYIELN